MDYIQQTLERIAQYTDEKPSADSLLIACVLSAGVDALQRHNQLLDSLADAADESNRMNERRLNRGQ